MSELHLKIRHFVYLKVIEVVEDDDFLYFLRSWTFRIGLFGIVIL